jgi:hypothetical protein
MRNRLLPLGFFAAMLAWIAIRMWIGFRDEFPALHLLCKWDCGWYESIARQGYVSPIPPLFQSSEYSNVAFFPAYPMIGRTLSNLLAIDLHAALPLTSILSAAVFSVALHRVLETEKPLSRRLRQLVLLGYPAGFYLFVSYSESLYLATLFWVIALVLRPRGTPSPLALPALAVCGYLAGATRLTGFVIPGALFAGSLLWSIAKSRRLDRGTVAALVPFAAAGAGILSFLAFCAARFGVWNLYFWQLRIGWYKEFSPPKALELLLHPRAGIDFVPAHMLEDTRRISWVVATAVILGTLYACARAVPSALRALREERREEFLRSFLRFGSAAHLFIVLCGDVGPWDAWGNGMRYSMPSAFLLVVFFSPDWIPAAIRRRREMRLIAAGALVALVTYFFRLEWDLLARFIRNQWVS